MAFMTSLPWWAIGVGVATLAGLAVWSYQRTRLPLSAPRRATLIVLRIALLWLLFALLLRPVTLRPPTTESGREVVIVADTSRSMRLLEGDGRTRMTHAADVMARVLLPALQGHHTARVVTLDDTTTAVEPGQLAPVAARSDLAATVAAVRAREAHRAAAIVLVSDGGETGSALDPVVAARPGPPVFAIGVGRADAMPDVEVTDLSASDPRLGDARVALHVAAVSRARGRAPFTLTLRADGRAIETRQVQPPTDDAPVRESFLVTPNSTTPTVYAVVAGVVGTDAGDAVPENDTRSLLLNPAARARRVLLLGGAPGFDYSFLARALSTDPSLDVDAIVRKGKDDRGTDTYVIQAAAGRGAALADGFPATRDALFVYDAVVLANREAESFTAQQAQWLAEFVAARGGGLLLTGPRALAPAGLAGSPLSVALPVDSAVRQGLDMRAGQRDAQAGDATPQGTVARGAAVPTMAGLTHPVMQLGVGRDATLQAWHGLPALADVTDAGGVRAGASVLAVSMAASGAVLPLVATHAYGRGRSLVFTGDAAWRWRMARPSNDTSYEAFWRQAVRWLCGDVADPVRLTTTDGADGRVSVDVEVRDASYGAVSDATVTAVAVSASGTRVPVTLRAQGPGHLSGGVADAEPGAYRVEVEAMRGGALLGQAERWVLVGGHSDEFADPRIHDDVLRALATATGGAYAPADRAPAIVEALAAADVAPVPDRVPVWHTWWVIAVLIALASAEWSLRRWWGLR